jgi:hypothetical protein
LKLEVLAPLLNSTIFADPILSKKFGLFHHFLFLCALGNGLEILAFSLSKQEVLAHYSTQLPLLTYCSKAIFSPGQAANCNYQPSLCFS